jgi:hypothetical protein
MADLVASQRITDMNYKLSQVQSTMDDRRSPASPAFNILNQYGAPLVTFRYLDQKDAVTGHALIERAIAKAVLIAPHKSP